MTSEMAKKPQVERRVTSGNLWTIAVMVAGILGGTGYNHFVPSDAAKHASDVSDAAVQKAADVASKAAVMEKTVTEHTQELGEVMLSMSDMKSDIAVLKSQGAEAKQSSDRLADKMDKMLMGLARMQGRMPAGTDGQK